MSNNPTSTQNPNDSAFIVTANEENGWVGITISAKGLNDSNFNTNSVSHNVVGGVKEIGVKGNTTPGNSPPDPELGYDPVTHKSEQIQAVFQSPVNNIKVGLDLFFGSEKGTGEIGQWTAFDANGHQIGCGTFENIPGGVTQEICIQTDVPFSKVVFSALPYSNQGSFKGDSSDYSITYIKYTNHKPEACDDVNSIKEDTAPNPVSGNVLSNDHDSDGNILSVTNAGTFTLAHGTLVIQADGKYTYTLNNADPAVNALNDGQKLSDSFTYKISDGHGGTDSGSLTITINGTTDEPTCGCHCGSTPPGAASDAPVNTAFGTVLNDTLLGKDGFINTIYAGAGNDNVTGGDDAKNIIYAESGHDLIQGGFHSVNELYGASGPNHLIGGDCSINTIFGGGGDATIDGGNMHSTNTMYAGGGVVTMHGGNDSTNVMYAEWGNGVVITGGNNAENTFFDGGGNATYYGGIGDNLFVFNDLKYPLLSQGIQGNKVFPVALTNQDVTSNFEYVSNGVDTVHGNANSTENVLGLIGRLDKQTWTINLTNASEGDHMADGSWVAHAGHTLSGTITNNINGAVVTFDTINKVVFLT